MAYEQLEELTSRKREKVALFLTAENMVGLLVIGLPAYIATASTAFWLRSLILLAAAVLGVLLTSEIHGLACYERALWWARGWARRRVAGAILRPAEFTAVAVVHDDRPLPLGGPVRRVQPAAVEAGEPTRLGSVVRTATALRYRGSDPARRGRAAQERVVAGSNGQGTPANAGMAVVVADGDRHRC